MKTIFVSLKEGYHERGVCFNWGLTVHTIFGLIVEQLIIVGPESLRIITLFFGIPSSTSYLLIIENLKNCSTGK